MAKYDALFEDDEDIFGGTPESKYHDVANNASGDIVKDEFNNIVEKFAIMEKILQKEYGVEKLEQKISQYSMENRKEIELHKKSLFIEFTGNIVMRLDS